MSGYLRKKQKNGAKWKRLWFVLRDGILYAFKAPEDLLPADTISIMGYKLEILSEHLNSQGCMNSYKPVTCFIVKLLIILDIFLI